jgi:hypothetical protein
MNSLGRRTLVALAFGLATTATRAEVVLYANDFETAIGTEWSSTSTTDWGLQQTPADDTGGRFLGYFGGDNRTSLTLTDLPSGLTSLTLEFDAYLMWSWDGEDTRPADGVPRGPDRFGFQSGAGNPLIVGQSWTFSHGSATTGLQSFCGDGPAPCAPTTGALSRYSLGYRFEIVPTEEDLDTTGAAPMDSVYRFSWTAAHDGSTTAQFTFFSAGLQVRPDLAFPYLDEAWGLDNVRVIHTPIPEPAGATLLALGLALLAVAHRRSRHRDAC